MASCLKCGGTTHKTAAKQQSCRRCGVQPGPTSLDRSGTISFRPRTPYTPTGPEYIMGTVHTPRLKGKAS